MWNILHIGTLRVKLDCRKDKFRVGLVWRLGTLILFLVFIFVAPARRAL